jgi:dihydroorotate dehydrogenase (NAD+) catalytic subunit
VRRARKLLRRGQVLIVSIAGTPRPGGGEEALAEDYALCARWAAEAGAHIVEANYSCPNVCTAEGSIYEDAAASRRLSTAIREALPSTPFLIKAGYFRTSAALRSFYAAVDPFADGVVLVNGLARRVVGRDGKPAFRGFERVGILGRAIHRPAVAQVRSAVALTRRRGLRARTLAVGGVMNEDDPADFFDAGAAAVLLGGAPMMDPHLAIGMKRRHPSW